MTIRFDDAWPRALGLAHQAAEQNGLDVLLVRDVLGRVSLVLDDSNTEFPATDKAMLDNKLRESTQPFTAPAGTTLASTLFAPDKILHARDLVVMRERTGTSGRVSTLERGIVGSEWLRLRSGSESPRANRVTLYAFGGGVGRSSAAFMLAQHLADHGRCVLVADLDLESPGVRGCCGVGAR